METVGDKTRLDDLKTAHVRSVEIALHTEIATVNGTRFVNVIELLGVFGVSIPMADAAARKLIATYYNEMAASWNALFSPIPIKKPEPAWKVALQSTGRVVVYALAAAQVIDMLNDIVRILT